MHTQHFTFMGKEFTLREMQVIALNALGLKQRQVAAYLGCSEATVKTHLRHIRHKLAYEKDDSISRKLASDSLSNGMDRNGNYLGIYLFTDHGTGLPW